MERRSSMVLAALAFVLAAASAGAIVTVYRSARSSVTDLLTRRMEAAGLTAARLLTDGSALGEIATANELDAAYVVDADFMILADARGHAGRRANLLRLDADRARGALGGKASLAWAYDVDGTSFLGGYFPLQAPGRALVLEAGETFSAPSRRLRVAATAAFVVDAAMLALALVGIAWAARAARREREAFGGAERAGLASRMAAMVAHEVRNPLSIILAAAELVRPKLSAGDDQELVDDIRGEVHRLSRLTDEFLTLSRDQPLDLTDVQLERMAEEVCHLVALRYEGRPLCFAVEGEATVRGDADKLRQALLNLVLNAAQAVDAAGDVRVEIEQRDRVVRLRIRDDGPGISADMVGRLFEPFATGKASGTGLGLAVARRIVERHRGTLTCVPVERGACFEARIPQGREAT
jgi:two-component system OmpR family sensor kinase